MKKTLSILALVAIIISSCFYFFIQSNLKIFLMKSTKKRRRPIVQIIILRNIDGFKISPGWPMMENILHTPLQGSIKLILKVIKT